MRSDTQAYLNEFVGGMQALGYREGDNLSIDAQYADYSPERAGRLAAEIAERKPAVIVTSGGGITPATKLTPPLPVVFVFSGDPVEAGYADSLARPGRNATGITLLALDLIGKRLEFLKQIKPKLQRLAFLASPLHPGQKGELAASRAAANQLGIEVLYHEARTPDELAAALPLVAAEKVDGALLFSDALMIGQRQKLAEFFLRERIPSAAGWSAFPESGHLLSYGPERSAVWRRIAYFVDRILRGVRPADLPIELPTIFEFAVNRRTASQMGLSLPQGILARADRVIQ
jgi:putative ABC transport system substrate-binding protein